MDKSKNPMAAGVVVAMTTMAGAVWGAREGQVSAGLLLGLVAGGVLAVIFWLFDRRR